ncbi:MAG: M15 family metallopeptidase [Actinobacteria bacterium]|nr:M15 family metallopeptidase [Actinomycetota bacterium]
MPVAPPGRWFNRGVRSPRVHKLSVSVVLATLVVLAAPPAPASAGEPAVQPDNRPTPLAGVENGYVPSERLISVAPGCRVAREAGPSLALLFRSASGARVRLGGRDCYRPISGQVAVASAWSERGNSACAATPQYHPDGRPKGTSMHGWGKAVDFSEGSPMTFTSPGYRFLKANAGRLGWNHPGWAEPGGSACPEPWHWEWVGDGGTMGGDPVRADVVGLLAAADEAGYATVTGLGGVRPRGSARSFGSAETIPLNWVVVGAASTPDRSGYWLLGGDGGIFNFGTAAFHGSTGSMRLNSPVVGMAPTPDGGGYWLVAGDGGIFSFGTARFHGSTGSMRLNSPVVGMAPTPDGGGYWLVAADGGMFGFGTAAFHGSTGDIRLNQPVVGMSPTSDGGGYWLVASDGGIFNFGNAGFLGSAADRRLPTPVVGMTRTARGDGYWIVSADGTVVNLGAAGHFGSG